MKRQIASAVLFLFLASVAFGGTEPIALQDSSTTEAKPSGSRGKKKIWIGVAMMAGGAALVASAITDFDLGGNSGSDELKFYSGSGLFIAGTTTFIVGLVQHSRSGGNGISTIHPSRGLHWDVGAAPTAKGFVASARIRW